MGLPNYWGVLLATGIVSLFYAQVCCLSAPKSIVCTGASLQSVLSSLFAVADTIMLLTCFYNLRTGTQETWEPDLGRESPYTRYYLGNPLSTLWSLAWLMHCFVYAAEEKLHRPEKPAI